MREVLKLPLILVGFLAFATSLLVLDFSAFTLILFGFALFRLFRTSEKKIILLGFICLALVSLVSFRQVKIRERNIEFVAQNENLQQVNLTLDMDTIKVSGDLLTFNARTKNGRVQASYILQSQEEQELFKNQTNAINIRANGELSLGETPRNFGNFDYRDYLRTNQFLGSLKIDTISQIAETSGFNLRVLRRKLIVHIQKSFPNPLRDYMTGLILGFQSRDFEDTRKLFQSLGIVHLFTLSGMQVGFFIELFRKFLLRIGLSVERSFWLLLVFSAVYFALAGFTVSVLRAILQKVLTLTSRRFSLRMSEQSIFGLVVFLSVLFRPYLFLSVSGQLSFGIGFLLVFLKPATSRFSKIWQQNFLFSLGISIGILPLIWCHFYEWNPFSILLSMLFVFVFQRFLLPILVSAFLLSFLFPLVWLNHIFELFESITAFIEQILGGSWIVGQPTFWGMIFLFCAVVFGLVAMEQKKLIYSFLSVLIFLAVAGFTSNRPTGILAMLDVGQADSFFIQTPFGKETTLIDVGGRMDFPASEDWREREVSSTASRTLIPFLKARGVRKIDHLYISHGHLDHYGDILELAQNIKIERLYFPKYSINQPKFKETLKELQANKVKLIPLSAPKKLEQGYLLAPTKANDENENNHSLVIYRKFDNLSFLFTGDMEKEQEEQLLKDFPDLKADILKAGHHGSKTSSHEAFLDQIQPKLVLISAGKNNRFKHPSSETLEKLAQRNIPYYLSAEDKMVYFTISPFSRQISSPKSLKYDRIEED